LANVLLVEDDELVRLLLVDVLEEGGYRIAAATRPSEALQVLDGDVPVDVLVTDLALPEMNGVALIRLALARRPDLAVIIASGHSPVAAELPNRPIPVLKKPFHPKDLLAAVRRVLALREPDAS
jgi:DNA-binding NtrC family response regulator